MCSLRRCTIITLRYSLECYIPFLRFEMPLVGTWRTYSWLNLKSSKQGNSNHFGDELKQYVRCTSYHLNLRDTMSRHYMWNSLRLCSKWSPSLLDADNLTFLQNSNNYHNHKHASSFKYFSSTKITETRKKVSKKMEEIKENVLTVPNGLCLLRMISTPVLGYLVLQEWYATSLGLFIFAGFTDVVDGYIARNFPSQQSMIGSFLDPAADKMLIATLFVTLTVNGLIPVPLTSLIIFRDICLMGAGFYIRYVSLPSPKTLARYFDMSFVTARLSPTGISKVNTLVQLSLVACSLAAPVFDIIDHSYLEALWYITAVSTVLSAGSYLCYKNTYKVFATRMGEKEK